MEPPTEVESMSPRYELGILAAELWGRKLRLILEHPE